jgi:hypothetical protein
MRSIQDGKEASTKEGCQWSLGLSKDGGCAGGMQHGNHCHFIQSRRQTIAMYVATRLIFRACLEGKWQQGLMLGQWWWEQPMCLDAIDAIGSNANDGQLDAPAPPDA